MTALVLVVVVVQAATGALWWALIRRGPVSVIELVGVGTALGTFAAMISATALVSTPLSGIAWLVPTAAVIVASAIGRDHLRDLSVTAPLRELVATGTALVAGVVLLAANWSRIPLDAPSTDSYVDLHFFEALSRGLAQFGPRESILMSGGDLRYHWFTYAWAGDLAQSAGTAPFVVLTRVLPAVAILGAACIAAAWAARLSRVRWVPTLAALLVVAGGYAGALYGAILNFDSPSQALTTVWLMALLLTVAAYVRAQVGPWSLLVIAALACACTGGKASHAIVAAAGLVLLVVVGVVVRARWWRRASIAAAVSAGVMAATYLAVLAGVALDRNVADDVAVKASTWQGLDPFDGRLGVALGTLALLAAILARLAGLGWLAARSLRTPDVALATGGVAAGIIAMLVLRQGVNELWFVLAASAAGSVVSAAGAGSAARRASRSLRRPLAWAVGIAALASAVVLVLTLNWSTHQRALNAAAPFAAWALSLIGAVVAVIVFGRRRRISAVVALAVVSLVLTSVATRPSSLWTSSRAVSSELGTAAGEAGTPAPGSASGPSLPWPAYYAAALDAATWVEANTARDAVLATSDPLSALVPALTGRVMYLAGQAYQAGLGRAGQEAEVAQRWADSVAFAEDPDVTTAAPLCAAGVDYAWLEGDAAADAPADAVAFANEAVTVVRLPGWVCP